MSIASRIQEMETHIGNAYTSIDNLGIDISNTNKNIYNISALLDTFYDSLPKVSGIGTSLSLSPTMVGKIKLNEIQGDTLQDGTPTPDAPVEIQSVTGLQNVNVCGKNLCFNVTKPSNTNLKFFINKSISKTFTISFTTNEALNGNSLYLEVDGTGYGNLGGITANANTKVEKTYTLSDANYQAIENGTNIDLLLYKNGANFNIPDDGMVENNSTATTYEPYKGNTYEVNLGKNLLQNQATDTTSNGITYTIDDKGGITANDTATALSYILPQTQQQSPLYEAGTYTFSLLNDMTNKGYTRFEFYKEDKTTRLTRDDIINGSTTITLSEKGYLRVSYIINNGVTVNNFYNMIQVEKGTQSTSFSPYFTPIELNKIGDYQDSIKKSTGKNLFDKDTITSGYRLDPSGESYPDTNCFLSEYIPVEPNTIYTRNVTASAYECIGFYTSDKTFISRNTSDSTTTTPSNSYYVRITGYNTNLNTMQLEKGNQATSYEPYGKVWYEEKQTRKLELAIADMDNSDNYPGWKNQTQLKNDVFDGTIVGSLTGYTNYYVNIGEYNFNGIKVNFNNQATLFIDKSIYNYTQTEWKTSFPNLIVTLVYNLKIPEYETITNTELINQLEALNTAKSQEGTTNISITSEDLEMILNVSALKGEE